METLNTVLFDNSVKDYLITLGLLILVFALHIPIANLVTSIIKRILSRFVNESNRTYFKKVLRRPIAFLLLLIGFTVALNFLTFPSALEIEFYGKTLTSIIQAFMELIYAVVLTWFILKLVDFFMLFLNDKAEQTDTKEDDQMVLFIKDIAKVFIIFSALLFVLGNIFHVNVSSLIAGAGIAGLAIALAAKESLENLLGSFTIFIEKPFTVGDYIKVGDVDGIVEKVGFRSTRIRTLDKSYVTLPNRKIIDTSLDNKTLRTLRRVVHFVGVEYGTSKQTLQTIIRDIQETIDSNPYTNENGLVSFYEFGDSALNVRVEYYVNVLDWSTYVRIKEEINFKIMEIVEQNGSDFAFPTQTIHLKKDNSE